MIERQLSMLPTLFLLIAFFSEVVGTIAGFGSSVFFVPLAGLLLGFHEVLALTSILHVFSNAAKLAFFGRHVRLRVLLLIGKRLGTELLKILIDIARKEHVRRIVSTPTVGCLGLVAVIAV